MKFSVALIYGGEGKEHKISCVSAKNLSSLIDPERFSVIPVFISEDGNWFIQANGESRPAFPVFLSGISGLYCQGEIIPIDVAVPALHGDFGEDGTVTGLLRTAHIPYVGCNTYSGAVCADKIITKSVADSLKIPTAKWIFANGEGPLTVRERAEAALSYPMIIKPSMLGSSIGISIALGREDFEKSYSNALSVCKRILIEEMVSVKCELECAYLSVCGRDLYATGAVLSNGKFYGFEEKYKKGEGFHTDVLGIDEETEKTVTDMTRRLKDAVGAEGLSRFDFLLCADGKILFNEINTFPGMTPTSLYPSLTEKMGLSKGEFINLLISEALK